MISKADFDLLALKIPSDSSLRGTYASSLLRVLYENQNNPKELRQTFCKEIFMTIPVVIYTQKDFYLLKSINRRIELLRDSGLINFWQKQDFSRLHKVKSNQPKVMKLKNLLGCFQILVFGCGCGFVVFIIELYLFK